MIKGKKKEVKRRVVLEQDRRQGHRKNINQVEQDEMHMMHLKET